MFDVIQNRRVLFGAGAIDRLGACWPRSITALSLSWHSGEKRPACKRRWKHWKKRAFPMCWMLPCMANHPPWISTASPPPRARLSPDAVLAVGGR